MTREMELRFAALEQQRNEAMNQNAILLAKNQILIERAAELEKQLETKAG